jgi:hypothetical protein
MVPFKRSIIITQHELVKPFKGVQLVKVQSGQSRSGQAGRESCAWPGDLRAKRRQQGSSPPSPEPGVVQRNPNPAAKGDRRWRARVGEQSHEPIVPVKVANRRAPEMGGDDTHWREGANG